MKIELTNKTHYREDHIRAFLKPMMQEERPDLCKRDARTMRVVIVYTRPGSRTGENARSCSGLGAIRGNWIKIRVPKNHEPDRIDFAHTIAHELAHTRGMRDEYAMRHSARYGRVGSWREMYAWADALPLARKDKPSRKPAPDKQRCHAESMLKAAMTREKRAATIRKKWQRRVTYYTRKAQVCASSTEAL